MAELTLIDGRTLTYADEGAGRPLLLVHGWAANGDFFHPQRRALARGFRVITPDLPGHGRSPAGAERLTIPGLAADLCALMAALDLHDAVAVGWSLGAMVVWSVLTTPAAERISAVAVIDMSPRILNDADWSLGIRDGYDAEAAAAARKAMVEDWPGFVRAMAPRIVAEGLEDERQALIDWIELEVARNDPAPLADLWGSMAEQDFRAGLERFASPTLIAHGAHSQLYDPETSCDLVRRLPHARRVAFARSGHAPQLEEPERFNQILTEFAAARTDGQPTAGSTGGHNGDYR